MASQTLNSNPEYCKNTSAQSSLGEQAKGPYNERLDTYNNIKNMNKLFLFTIILHYFIYSDLITLTAKKINIIKIIFNLQRS